MDKIQARKLIKETFEKPFDKGRFYKFAKELLNHIEEAPFTLAGSYIYDDFAQYISAYERIGKYQDGDRKIDILIVNLKRETSIERARTMQRNFIAKYLKQRGEKEAALVAFVSPNQADWRFSLVKMDYKFVESKTGRVKAQEDFTPARRWSFLVGSNENSHTAQSRLAPILEDDKNDPTLERLEEAFNIEKVTKEFFEKYRDLFHRVQDELDKTAAKDPKVQADFASKGIDTADFAKKLLGQIVFLYFLQKKGWFGVERDEEWGTGPKNFLRQLFESKHGSYKNFFNDILEPLFYEALAVERAKDFYSRFNCKIPFLNGGLFDPIGDYDWVHTDILLPNALFSNTTKTKEGDSGDGILDIFDRYNFTVKEDEPLEKEVAVDPEMLGKVFENLLEVKDRKSKGTYYTPREIVHYMCQQSLINYLYTACSEEAKGFQKIGNEQTQAFGNEILGKGRTQEIYLEQPISKEHIETLIKHGELFAENEARVESKGKESKDYKYKIPESVRANAELIDEKLQTIRVCDPAAGSGAFLVGMMSEIVKARNVLSSYLKPDGRSVYNFKRRAIQECLYGVDIDPGAVEIAKLRLWLSLVVDEEDIKKIRPLPNLDYKIVCGNSLLGVPRTLENYQDYDKLEKLKPLFFEETNPRKKQERKQEIDKLIFQITKGHKEFDFEVYFSEVFHEKKGFDVVIANPPYVDYREIDNRVLNSVRRFELNINSQRPNLFMYFIEKSYYILKNKGILVYINPNQFLSINSGFGLRKFLIENTIIKFFIDTSYIKVFKEAATYTTVWMFIKSKIDDYDIAINRCLDLEQLDNISFKISKKEILKERSLIIPINQGQDLFSKIEKDRLRLGQISNLFWGTSQTGYGKLKINKNQYALLPAEKKKKYKPILQTSDIKNYYIDWQEEYIPTSIYSEKVLRNFDKEKILVARLTKRLQCSFDKNGRFVGKATAITDYKKNRNFLLALLNSNLINYWYSNKFETTHMASGYLRFDIPYLEQIPIPKTTDEAQRPFIELVDRILAITQGEDYLQNPGKQAQVKEYEREIDRMVYELYGLTEEEIRVVEGKG